VGPVLAGETPRPEPTLPPGTYAEWAPDAVYQRGDRVMLGATAYEATWWTQGDSPEAAAVSAEGSPWRALGADEIQEVLGG